MLIRPHFAPPSPQNLMDLTVLLKHKADLIKNQNFRVSLSDNHQPHPSQDSFHTDNFSTMFKSITKRIKLKIKQEKRTTNQEKATDNQPAIFGRHICTNSSNQIQNKPPKKSGNCRKVKTTVSEPRFSYSQAEFSVKPNLNRRKMTSTNYSERICKGSTFSRLTYVDRKITEPNIKSKTKTETQVEPELDQDFVPIGQIQIGNNSYRYLKDIKQAAQAQSCNISEPDEEPLKQIYDKIFMKIPNPQAERRSKNSRNMRKLYSTYKMSYETRVERGGNDSYKYNFTSSKVIKPQIEMQPTFRKQSLGQGNTLGPWVQQKFY